MLLPWREIGMNFGRMNWTQQSELPLYAAEEPEELFNAATPLKGTQTYSFCRTFMFYGIN